MRNDLRRITKQDTREWIFRVKHGSPDEQRGMGSDHALRIIRMNIRIRMDIRIRMNIRIQRSINGIIKRASSQDEGREEELGGLGRDELVGGGAQQDVLVHAEPADDGVPVAEEGVAAEHLAGLGGRPQGAQPHQLVVVAPERQKARPLQVVVVQHQVLARLQLCGRGGGRQGGGR